MANRDVERYRILAAYHATERQIFVSRSQIFVFTNAALIAFVSGKLPDIATSASWGDICTSGIGVALGAGLLVGWRRAIDAGNWWIHRFRFAMLKFEQGAMGEVNVFRGVRKGDDSDQVDRAGTIWHYLLVFFAVFWTALGVWVSLAATIKGTEAITARGNVSLSTDRVLLIAIAIPLTVAVAVLLIRVSKLKQSITDMKAEQSRHFADTQITWSDTE